jgi:hypothetical protein
VDRQRIVRLTNGNVDSRVLFADAVMILNSNRPERLISTLKKKTKLNRPGNFKLHQNFPNPFNPATRISYSLKMSSHVRLVIFDATGKELRRLLDTYKHAGNHVVDFNAVNFPSGLYFYSLQAGNHTETRKMLILK